MTFVVATYNVLAPSYVRSEWYVPESHPFLDPAARLPALGEHIERLDADIVCLQEVEGAVFAALGERLSAAGYSGTLALKGGGRPDGCAILHRLSRFERVDVLPSAYRDGAEGGPASGHLVQLLLLRHAGHLLGVANTHLKWDPPETAPGQGYGERQATELVSLVRSWGPPGTPWLVCGDFNAGPGSRGARVVAEAGLQFSHLSAPHAATCNANRHPAMVDFIFHDPALRVRPRELPAIGADTPLPGPGQPSDHLAVLAELDWPDASAPA